jgi:cytoskeleton protein RodZ
MRGITLDEIAEATKIGTRSLRALEQEQFDRLPGGIFNKGFVRAYARFLGIDEEQAVADYLAVTNESVETPAADNKSMQPVAAVEAEREPEPAGANPSWRALAIILLVMALIAGGWYAYNRWRARRVTALSVEPAPSPAVELPSTQSPPQATPRPQTPAPEKELPPPAAIAKPAVTAKAASDLKPPAAAAPASSDQEAGANPAILLHIRARTDAWMQVTADDKVILSAILPANAEKVVRADRLVVLDIGNAGGVEITQNGKPLPALGPEGKHLVLTITPQGIKQ